MKDPVCGMEVKSDSRFRSRHNGTEYLFCSLSCKENFDKNPARYVK